MTTRSKVLAAVDTAVGGVLMIDYRSKVCYRGQRRRRTFDCLRYRAAVDLVREGVLILVEECETREDGWTHKVICVKRAT